MDTGSQYILSWLDHALDVLNLFFEHEEPSAATAAELPTVWPMRRDRLNTP